MYNGLVVTVAFSRHPDFPSHYLWEMGTRKQWNVLFEQCFTPALTHAEGDLVFVSKSTWPVSFAAAHKVESLASPILQVCQCPLCRRRPPPRWLPGLSQTWKVLRWRANLLSIKATSAIIWHTFSVIAKLIWTQLPTKQDKNNKHFYFREVEN